MDNDSHNANAPGPTPLFSLGRVVATVGAIGLMENTGTNPASLLARHVRCDWGELCAEDVQTNREALANGWRLMSVYRLPVPRGQPVKTRKSPRNDGPDTRIWIITEADRSITTLLLPEEY